MYIHAVHLLYTKWKVTLIVAAVSEDSVDIVYGAVCLRYENFRVAASLCIVAENVCENERKEGLWGAASASIETAWLWIFARGRGFFLPPLGRRKRERDRQRERVETSWLETDGKRVRKRGRRERMTGGTRSLRSVLSELLSVTVPRSCGGGSSITNYASAFFFCSSSLVVHFHSRNCVPRRIWHTHLSCKFASSAPRLVLAHPLLRVPSILVLLSTFGVSRVAGKTGRIMVSEKMQAARLLVIVSLWERVRSKRERFAEEKEQNLTWCDLACK